MILSNIFISSSQQLFPCLKTYRAPRDLHIDPHNFYFIQTQTHKAYRDVQLSGIQHPDRDFQEAVN